MPGRKMTIKANSPINSALWVKRTVRAGTMQTSGGKRQKVLRRTVLTCCCSQNCWKWLELRQYKKDSIESISMFVLKLSHFFTGIYHTQGITPIAEIEIASRSRSPSEIEIPIPIWKKHLRSDRDCSSTIARSFGQSFYLQTYGIIGNQ